jgi:polysaccharide biosynthesis protein PslJ
MTTVALGRQRGRQRRGAAARTARRQHDTLGLLTCFLLLLVLVPSRLVFKPLGASGTPAAMLALFGLMSWACAWLVPSLTPGRWQQPVRWAIGLFGLAVLASYLPAVTTYLAGGGIRSADRGLITVAVFAGIALMVADGIHTRKRLDTLMKRLTLAGAILAGIGIMQFLTGIDPTDYIRIPGLSANEAIISINARAGFRRVAGTAVHPIEFGVVLAMILPIALYVAFSAPKRTGFWRWTAVALIGMAIPMSLSRSAFLGLFTAAMVILPTWSGRRLFTAALLLPVFAVAMRSVASGLLGTIKSLFTGLAGDPSFQGRTEDYAVVGQFIGEAPLFGRGFGTFDPVEFVLLDNQYLGTLIETGAFGLLMLIVLFLIGIFTARGARRRSVDERERELAQSIAASIAVAMVSFLTFDAFAFPMASEMTFFMLGCAGAAWRIAVTRERARAARVSASAGPVNEAPSGEAGVSGQPAREHARAGAPSQGQPAHLPTPAGDPLTIPVSRAARQPTPDIPDQPRRPEAHA